MSINRHGRLFNPAAHPHDRSTRSIDLLNRLSLNVIVTAAIANRQAEHTITIISITAGVGEISPLSLSVTV